IYESGCGIERHNVVSIMQFALPASPCGIYNARVSRIAYVANIRLPTEKAHGAQIMKTCEALARAGAEVELIVTDRKSDIAEDPFAYYQVEKNFSITRVKVVDTVALGPLGFFIESISFGLGALKHLRGKDTVAYSRDEVPLSIASLISRRIVFE